MKKCKILKFAAAAVCAAFLAGCGQINSDEAGFKTSFGKISTPVLGAGLYFINPVGGALVRYTTRDVRSDIMLSSYTKDMQQADFKVAIVYAIDRSKLTELHVKYGKEYAKVVVEPIVQSAVKVVVGVWEADQLVNKRGEATKAIKEKIMEATADKPVLVKDVEILDISYKDAFEKAIEAKQVAAQAALEAKNRTVQVEEEARQKLIIARSIAESMDIQGKAIRENKDIILFEAIQKWDGKAPNTLVVGSEAGQILQGGK